MAESSSVATILTVTIDALLVGGSLALLLWSLLAH